MNRALFLRKDLLVVLSLIVIVLTFYLLMLPGITMEKVSICDKVEHIHSEDCYENIDKLQIDEVTNYGIYD